MGLGGCGSSPQPQNTPRVTLPARSPQEALRRGLDYLESRQESDGAWRSQNYRDMAAGYELTPIVAKALIFSGRAKSAARGIEFVNAGLDTHKPLIYPVYTAADMLLVLSRAPDPVHQKAWTKLLLSYQLSRENGWTPQDPDYGGWGYAMKTPRKGNGDPMAHSNLTSTCFAVGALRVGGLKEKDPSVVAARTFVQHCQSTQGGFFSAPVVAGQVSMNDALNKAGPGVPYGSASADGVRCLLRCGAGLDDPALRRGVEWMLRHFDPLKHSGDFPTTRYEDRDSLYFYYVWSTAHALAGLQRSGDKTQRAELAAKVSARLLELQQLDGSWRNPLGATREDDPLVATPMALAALALCQGFRP